MRIFAFVLSLCAVLMQSGWAAAAVLRSHTTVTDGFVRLGDLFEGIAAGADIVVARAPAPGRQMTFDAATLYRLAQAYRIDWRPQSRFDRTLVQRVGRIIPASDIVARLDEAIAAEANRTDFEVELSQRQADVILPIDATPSVEVRDLSLDPQGGRFTAMLVVGGDHPAARHLMVSGRVHATVRVPVLRRTIDAGDIINKGDIEWIRVRESRIGGDTITDPARLIGTTPRRRLKAGELIREGETRPPVVVDRNSTVTILLQVGNMTLTAQGRATEDGAKGDVIRVVNLQSKRTIEATVEGPDLVTVSLVTPRALN
ncbi:MAG TPA: flagellar basal body P-ring formation chaperone FlgA [Alphaproteobacteria bacterium]